jgi:tetratricopeptide (TPR) repeat protein
MAKNGKRLINYFRLLIVSFFLFFIVQKVSAQLINDTPTQQLVIEAIDHIYNYEFNEIEPLAKQIRAKYPNHPVNSLLKAMQWQWQYLPVKDNKTIGPQYLQTLEQCLKQAKILEKTEATRPEAAFFAMASHGYIGLVHNHNEDRLKAAGEAKRGYNYVMNGFDLMNKNAEFYFSTGLYNYYIVQYPEEHSIVKPLTLFFRDGNKELGLKQLEIGSKKGTFTRTEATFFIARIYMKHEAKPEKAIPFSQILVQKYPQNPVYLMKHTEALILAGRYAEAIPNLEKLKKFNEKFFPTAAEVFEGLIQEKHYKKDAEAADNYQRMLRMTTDDEFTKHYLPFAYAGLARIADRLGDRKRATILYKKVAQTTEYEHLRRESKKYLK